MPLFIRSLGLAMVPFLSGCLADGVASTALFRLPADSCVVAVSGNLVFGDVPVGSERDLFFTITNTGNATLTVTHVSIDGGLRAHTLTNWQSGRIAAGASQVVGVRFQPLAAGSYHGVITVHGDYTRGLNTVHVSAIATAPAVFGVATDVAGEFRQTRLADGDRNHSGAMTRGQSFSDSSGVGRQLCQEAAQIP